MALIRERQGNACGLTDGDLQVLSAGLDVYEREPEVEAGLLDNPKVMLLPHIGTATFETQKEMEILVLDNLRSSIEKGEMITQVPEQKKTVHKAVNGTNGNHSNGNGNGYGSGHL